MVWLDVTRLLAMYLVVCCHSADPFNFFPGTSPHIADIKFWSAAYGSLLRPCVPLFVMITGALLLPVRQEVGAFYRRRISRVAYPFVIWSVIYCLFPWFTRLAGCAPDVMLHFFPYAGEDAMSQSLGVCLNYMAQIPVNFSPIGVHLWYIYLLIGIYLYLPIFSAWVERAGERAKLWFLAAWGVATLLPYLREFVAHYVWGECSWNEFGMLYYFAGFNGYLLLGHYLRHHHFSLPKTLAAGVPMFVAGYLITFWGFRHYTALPACTEEQLELFFTYCSPNVVMMTAPLFTLCKHAEVKAEWAQRLLANLTKCGFGVYMLHYMFTGPSVILIRATGMPLALQIPAAGAVAMAISWAAVAALYRLMGQKARYVVG